MRTIDRIKKYGLILLGLFILFLVFSAFRLNSIYQSELPSFQQLHNIEPSLKTKLYDRNGILLTEFYNENRVLTPYKDIPDYLINMLLASEDQEFFDHWGINVRRVGIVGLTNLIRGKITGGASTITQQLSRMIFLTREKTIDRKIKEALTAIKLERTYSKEEILEMYLNQYYFSRGAYGISAAANIFFSKKVSELNLNDCAIIIGTLKGPNINSPLNNIEKSFKARNRVLFSYYNYGMLSREVYDSLKTQPIEINPPEKKIGKAPYFTETVRQYILKTYGENVLYSGGLKVYTSLDVDLQYAAEKAVLKKLDSLQARVERKYKITNKNYSEIIPDTLDERGNPVRKYKQIQGAFIALDNSNGDILAMVGGNSFEETKYNRAVQALRQPGSSFKPFIYTACMDNGFHTTDIVDDNPIVLDIPGTKQWRPKNFDKKFRGPITIREGITYSRNLVAIRLLLKIGPQQAIFYARKMGITTPLADVPSLAIGVSEVHLIELVSAYSVFANQGILIPHRYIHKIVDRYGSVLEDNNTILKEEVLSEQTAYIMVDLMKSVVDKGTGRSVRWRGFTRPAGGKTGTSDNFCDNWFIGYTPQITAGTWIGFDDKTSIGRGQDGAKNGVPVWTEFMIAAHDSLPTLDFIEPEGILHFDACLESGELATDRCIEVLNEVFIDGTEPTIACHLHPSTGLYRVDSDDDEDRKHF